MFPFAEGSSAVSDVFWLQSLIARLSDCVEHGKLLPFSDIAAKGSLEDEMPVMFYNDDPDRRNYMDIVLDMVVDELHCDIVSTYSDVLRTVDVRLFVQEEEAKVYYDLSVFNKGEEQTDTMMKNLFSIDLEDPVRGICA